MRIDWDKYEVALLIKTYVATENLTMKEKNECYSVLSSLLRQKAINAGKAIDERYRNQNGIAMRIANIRFLFTGKGLRAYSALDATMYNIYCQSPKEFSDILSEAIRMTDVRFTSIFSRLFSSKQASTNKTGPVSTSKQAFDDSMPVNYIRDPVSFESKIPVSTNQQGIAGTSKQNGFFEWLLSEGFAVNSARSYSSAVKTSSEYAIQNGISAIPLFDYDDKDALRECLHSMFENTEFAAINMAQHNRQHAALQKYFQYSFGETTSFLSAIPYTGHRATTRMKGMVHPNQEKFLNWLIDRGFAPGQSPILCKLESRVR